MRHRDKHKARHSSGLVLCSASPFKGRPGVGPGTGGWWGAGPRARDGIGVGNPESVEEVEVRVTRTRWVVEADSAGAGQGGGGSGGAGGRVGGSAGAQGLGSWAHGLLACIVLGAPGPMGPEPMDPWLDIRWANGPVGCFYWGPWRQWHFYMGTLWALSISIYSM